MIAVNEAEASMKEASKFLQAMQGNAGTENCSVDVDQAVGVSVTVDGTWQKRYGYNSLLGVVFIMSVDTGEVLDYQTKSKICFECKARTMWDQTSQRYVDWFTTHKDSCVINHTGSSESMEKQATIELFSRSVDMRGLRYLCWRWRFLLLCKSAEAMNELYGDSYKVVKEDCVGHIQKRMGSNLRTYKKNMKGKKLSDGVGVGGRGRLTDAFVDKLQNYYGSAIRNNSSNLQGMQDAIWAIFHHCITGSEPLSEQHKLCPQVHLPGAGINKMSLTEQECIMISTAYLLFLEMN